jgi:hypothetical protein
MKTRLLCLTLRILLASLPSLGSAADLLDTWTWRNPLPTGNLISAVAWGDDRYVAVGQVGTVLTSPDGAAWTPQTSGVSSDLSGVACHDGLFVAVGGEGMILTSPDGLAWTPRPSGTTSPFTGVVWGSDRFVAVGIGIAATSPDGLAWSRSTLDANLNSVTFGNGLYVGVGHDSSIRTSIDGVTWKPRNSGADGFLSGVAFGNGVFVMVGMGGGDGFLFHSIDGIVWTWSMNTPDVLFGVAYGNGRFVVAGGATPLVSPDGLTWTAGTGPYVERISFGNSQFVATRYGGLIATSPDGDAWTTRSTRATSGDLRGGVFADGKFVAVGRSIVTSPNGQAWTEQDSGVPDPLLLGIAHEQGLFVTVGGGGTILTSPDGVSWAKQVSGTTHFLSAVAYGNGRFLASGVNDSDTQRVFPSSPDGTNWTAHMEAGGPLSGLAYGKGLFVGVGAAGAIRTSADGVSWASRVSGTTETLRKVNFGNNQFVAVGANGTVVTSPNGITWTRRLSTGQWTDDLSSVAFGGGVFVAVGWGDVGGPLFVSTDGIRWSRHTQNRQGISLGPYGVCSGNGQFIIFGDAGAILDCDVRPRLGQASWLANGSRQIPLSGISGLRYSLEASTDLTDWSAVTNELANNGTATFTDASATNFRQHFYRGVWAP